eukprot:930446-Pelagomonas_calceolata.AAC.5
MAIAASHSNMANKAGCICFTTHCRLASSACALHPLEQLPESIARHQTSTWQKMGCSSVLLRSRIEVKMNNAFSFTSFHIPKPTCQSSMLHGFPLAVTAGGH